MHSGHRSKMGCLATGVIRVAIWPLFIALAVLGLANTRAHAGGKPRPIRPGVGAMLKLAGDVAADPVGAERVHRGNLLRAVRTRNSVRVETPVRRGNGGRAAGGHSLEVTVESDGRLGREYKIFDRRGALVRTGRTPERIRRGAVSAARRARIDARDRALRSGSVNMRNADRPAAPRASRARGGGALGGRAYRGRTARRGR
jgi:hypothetical protein